MPANSKKTDIRLMRGSTIASEHWIPNSGEPLIDLETMTFNVGDGTTVGGIPINTVTCHILEGTKDFNTLVNYGRFFISSFTNGPKDVIPNSRVFLTVEVSDIGNPEVWQTIKVIDGLFSGSTFLRLSIDGGRTWKDWKKSNASDGFEDPITGTTPGDSNVNNYIYNSHAYVIGMTNGPVGTEGCDGLLFTYTPELNSTNIYQVLYIVNCPAHAGGIYFRFSVAKNQHFNAPGYNWRALTDFLHRNFSNVTGVLQPGNGGTGRTNGTVGYADSAGTARYA